MSEHHAVDRVVAILDAIARASEAPTLTSLASAIDAPVSSTFDLVRGLERHGWVTVRDRRYRIGAAPFVLDLIAHDRAPHASFDIDERAEHFGLGTALAVRVGHHVVYTARSRRLVGGAFAPLVDEHVPRRPLVTAAGRLLLALAPRAARTDVLRALRRDEPRTVAAYEREVATIARSRVAWSDGLSDPRVAAVAVTAAPDEDEVAVVFFGDRVRDRRRLREVVDLRGAAPSP